MTTGPNSSPPRSRDRNRARIVTAARELWMRNPHASMDDIAVAAGMVRRTLYSHFSTREKLVIAVADDAADSVREIAAQADSDIGATRKLARMQIALWSIGHKLRALLVIAEQVEAAAAADSRRGLEAAVAAVIAEGQRTGEFSSHLPPDILTEVIATLAITLHHAAEAQRWEANSRAVATAVLVAVGVDPKCAARVVTEESLKT